MTPYRSVRLVVQNSTSVALSVESAEVLQGTWRSEDGLTTRGTQIAPQSAASLDCGSSKLQVGCEGFLRFGSVSGIVHLHWTLPWVGRFTIEHEADPSYWTLRTILYEESAASPAALLILTTPPPSPTPPPRRKR